MLLALALNIVSLALVVKSLASVSILLALSLCVLFYVFWLSIMMVMLTVKSAGFFGCGVRSRQQGLPVREQVDQLLEIVLQAWDVRPVGFIRYQH